MNRKKIMPEPGISDWFSEAEIAETDDLIDRLLTEITEEEAKLLGYESASSPLGMPWNKEDWEKSLRNGEKPWQVVAIELAKSRQVPPRNHSIPDNLS